MAAIAIECGVTRGEFFSQYRNKRLVKARMLVAIALRDLGLSLGRIGRVIRRDHTTVFNLLERAGYPRKPAYISRQELRELEAMCLAGQSEAQAVDAGHNERAVAWVYYVTKKKVAQTASPS